MDMTHTSPVWLLVSKAHKHTRTLCPSLFQIHTQAQTQRTHNCAGLQLGDKPLDFTIATEPQGLQLKIFLTEIWNKKQTPLYAIYSNCATGLSLPALHFLPHPCSLTQILPFVFIAVSPPTFSSGVWTGYPCTEYINIKILLILSFVFFYWMFFSILTLMKLRWLLVCKCCNKLTVSLWVCHMVIRLWYISNLWVATN